jgi:hypothetical protein
VLLLSSNDCCGGIGSAAAAAVAVTISVGKSVGAGGRVVVGVALAEGRERAGRGGGWWEARGSGLYGMCCRIAIPDFKGFEVVIVGFEKGGLGRKWKWRWKWR